MSLVKKLKELIVCLIFFILIIPLVTARQEIIDLDNLKQITIPLHLIELFLAIFICFMALKFFWITRPFNLFLVVYVAGGFFIVNSLLYILFYAADLIELNISFINVYIGSRVALIGMLVSLGALFYHLNRQMRKVT